MKNLSWIIICGLCLFASFSIPDRGNAQLLSADPLFEAAERGNYVDAQKAILAGSSPNVRGRKRVTALMSAARAGSVEIVTLLLDHNAILNLTDSEGNTALIHAALNDFENVVEILLRAGASINQANKQGKTAVMRAAAAGSSFSVSVLLSAGADYSMTDFTGRTAFDLARENRQNQVLKILKEADAK